MKKYLQLSIVLTAFFVGVLISRSHVSSRTASETPAVIAKAGAPASPTVTPPPSPSAADPVPAALASRDGPDTAAPSSTPVIVPNTLPAATPSPAPSPTDDIEPSADAVLPTPPPGPGQYRDGIYDGNLGNASYGFVQVRVFITGGQIANVQFLQYPDHTMTSFAINYRAAPKFTAEAIRGQSATVDYITGASATSVGFVESLGYALRQAS